MQIAAVLTPGGVAGVSVASTLLCALLIACAIVTVKRREKQRRLQALVNGGGNENVQARRGARRGTAGGSGDRGGEGAGFGSFPLGRGGGRALALGTTPAFIAHTALPLPPLAAQESTTTNPLSGTLAVTSAAAAAAAAALTPPQLQTNALSTASLPAGFSGVQLLQPQTGVQLVEVTPLVPLGSGVASLQSPGASDSGSTEESARAYPSQAQGVGEAPAEEQAAPAFLWHVANCHSRQKPYFYRKGLEDSTVTWDPPPAGAQPVNIKGGWRLHVSLRTGEPYFNFEETGASRWDAPLVRSALVKGGGAASQGAPPPPPPPIPAHLVDDSNPLALGEGEGGGAALEEEAPPPPVLPPGWEAVFSRQLGCYYFHFPQTGEVSWEAP